MFLAQRDSDDASHEAIIVSQLAVARLDPAVRWWCVLRGTVGVAPSFAILVLAAQGGAQGDVRMWQLFIVLDDI